MRQHKLKLASQVVPGAVECVAEHLLQAFEILHHAQLANRWLQEVKRHGQTSALKLGMVKRVP